MRALLLVLLLAVAAQAQTDTVNSLYTWYLKGKQPRTFAPVRSLFEPAFYARLEALWHANEVYKQNLLDYDPVLGSQMGADSFRVVGSKRVGDEALVAVRLSGFRNTKYLQGVVLRQFGKRWLVTDFYTPGEPKAARATRIFLEIEGQVEQARQALKPETAVQGMLDSWAARQDFKTWWDHNRGRFTFECQDAISGRGELVEGLTAPYTVETPVLTGKSGTVAVQSGGKTFQVEVLKDDFGWRINSLKPRTEPAHP